MVPTASKDIVHALLNDISLSPDGEYLPFDILGMKVGIHNYPDQYGSNELYQFTCEQLLLSQTHADSRVSNNNRVTTERVKDPCSVQTVSALLELRHLVVTVGFPKMNGRKDSSKRSPADSR